MERMPTLKQRMKVEFILKYTCASTNTGVLQFVHVDTRCFVLCRFRAAFSTKVSKLIIHVSSLRR